MASSPNELLVSDRPVIVHRDAALNSETCIAVPVGPQKLFVAATEPRMLSELRKVSAKKLSSLINTEIVGRANRLVYGRDDRQIKFIQNRMGTDNNPSFVAQIIKNVGFDLAQIQNMSAMFENEELRKQISTAFAERK